MPYRIKHKLPNDEAFLEKKKRAVATKMPKWIKSATAMCVMFCSMIRIDPKHKWLKHQTLKRLNNCFCFVF